MTEQLIWAFDIGSRSVGWVAMKADENSDPTGEVVAANVVIHSGGILDDSKGTTRHAVRGMVVRNRRRLKRKKTRRRELKDELAKHGFSLQSGWRNRNPWWARSVLAAGPVEDPHRVRHLVATALPHMSKHRGWRNPWLRSPNPDPNEIDDKLADSVRAAATDLSAETGFEIPATLGAVSWALINSDGFTKVRFSNKEDKDPHRHLSAWIPKVMQEHIALEIAEIWRVQKPAHPDLFTDEAKDKVCAAVLFQEKPGVPLDRIGADSFGNGYRAPKSSPAFQRFRLLDVASNLRVKVGKDKRRLTGEERSLVLDILNRGEQIQWSEIEDALGLDGKLVTADKDGTAGRPPINVLAERLNSVKATGMPKLINWWDNAAEDRREALVAIALSDQAFTFEKPRVQEEVAKEIEGMDLLELVEKFGRALPPGRASYSRLVLNDLSDQMESEGIDRHDAIARTYGHEADKQQEKWDDPIPNAGVEASMKVVRGIVEELDAAFGPPAVIGVEIVREASLSHSEKRDRNERIKRERESRDMARNELIQDLNEKDPSNSLITKREHMTAQGNLCLYCGEVLNRIYDVELDHIVPRSTGGATIFNNLVATCRTCNHRKGDRTFAYWCEVDGEAGAARMEATLERVDNLTGPRWKATPARPYINADTGKWVYSELDMAKRAIRRRLQKIEKDREFDEAELHSTAFVSRIVTERLKVRYPETRVDVFRGGLTAAIRRETKLPTLLGKGDKKDRSDRRHHAIDAIAVALLTQSTWAARIRRRDEAFQNHRLGLISDEEFEKVKLSAPIGDLVPVMERVRKTGTPITDQIIPIMPRRLSTTGRIHEDTVRPWQPKRIGDAWNAKYISSVRDQEVAKALWRMSSSGGSIKEDGQREISLPDGTVLGPEDTTMCAIKLDEETGKETPVATWMAVRKGWAKTDEIHHARILTAAWNEKGKEKTADILVPLPVADVYGSSAPMSIPLSEEMVGVRGNPKLARVLAVDPSPQIRIATSITQGDGVRFEGEAWRITTFDAASNVAEAMPILLAGEDLKKLRKKFTAARFANGEVTSVSRSRFGDVQDPAPGD